MKYVQRLFTNKYFLYAIVLITILTILGYITDNKLDAVLVLMASGIIAKQFSANYSVILLVAVSVASLFSFVRYSMTETMAGFRSRYKRRAVEKFDNDNKDDDDDDGTNKPQTRPTNKPSHQQRVAQYNALKGKYKDLINTIRSKSQKIKEMARKIKV